MTLNDIMLSQLDLDTHFVEQSRRLGLITLTDVLNSRISTLSKQRDFSYSWYADLLTLLEDKGLLHEFQRRQL